jgi:beta-N-acetylhexosaminidase
MRDAHVATAAKHFPGLGRVRGNTDITRVVVDRVTRRHDRYLEPFQATVEARVPFVMMSLASYPRLDRTAPAVFSRKVIGGMLRHDLGFDGVVVSDDLVAAAVERWSPAQRALRFVGAGGDLVLVSTTGPVPQMYAALLAEARRSPGFRTRVDDAALHVLRAKQAQGLL